jgi:hypothetical protein
MNAKAKSTLTKKFVGKKPITKPTLVQKKKLTVSHNSKKIVKKPIIAKTLKKTKKP